MNNIQTQLKGFTTGNIEDISKEIISVIKTKMLKLGKTAEKENIAEDGNK